MASSAYCLGRVPGCSLQKGSHPSPRVLTDGRRSTIRLSPASPRGCRPPPSSGGPQPRTVSMSLSDPLMQRSISGPSRAMQVQRQPVRRRCLPPREEEEPTHQSVPAAHEPSSDAVVGVITALAVATAFATEPALAAKIDAFFEFNPVCPAADNLFRFGQNVALAIAGDENIENYRPLINDVLIRVRTEVCVLESFVRETATPFIREKGIGWVLPLRETNETYLAGVVFMVGANFILLGSTKVIAILAIYADLLLGLPARLGGKLLSAAEDQAERRYSENMDKLMDKQMEEVKDVMKKTAMASEREAAIAKVNAEYTEKMEDLKSQLDNSVANRKESSLGKAATVAAAVSVPLRIYGQASLTVRQVLEVFDTFCSRYFVTFTVTYIAVKTVHFVILPDFP